MTEVQTFRAATMQEALDRVRTELGSEAVILHTRQFTQRRLLPWKQPVEQVEITAGLGVNIRPPRLQTKRKPAPKPRPAAASPPPERPATKTETPDVVFERSADSRAINGQDASLRSLLQQLPASLTQDTEEKGLAAALPPAADAAASPTAEVATKLDSIQKMLEELGRQSRLANTHEIPDELFHVYADLIDAEVQDDLARGLVSRLKEAGTPEQLSNPEAVKSLLSGMVESDISCCGPITVEPGKRKVVALVGATGVGKTTTIAKLAANFRLREGVKMGLVTVDTYRIAAVEQLRTYAEIIDLPMKVVTSPPEMRRALDELVGLDLVLIDTAGRSPRDELQIQELKSLLAEAHVDEVHLVLNMTASLRTLEATAEKFAAANTTSLIMTKLDEAAGMGTMLSASKTIGLPISYLTTGQDVPDDIEPASASRIARLVLGRERLAE